MRTVCVVGWGEQLAIVAQSRERVPSHSRNPFSDCELQRTRTNTPLTFQCLEGYKTGDIFGSTG